MNTQKGHYILIILFLLLVVRISGQDSSVHFVTLEQARLEPFKMQVTYSKTSHLIFPSPIRYVDLGSEWLVADKAEPIGNVLRVKSAVRDFEEETNFSVITEDGKFYSFDVFYSTYPEALSYDLSKMQGRLERFASDVLFEDLKGNSSWLTERIMENLYRKKSGTIRHIVSKKDRIEFSVNALHVDNSKFYFTLRVNNTSNLAYDTGIIHFRVLDKKNLRSTAVQDKILEPLRIHFPIRTASHHSGITAVYMLEQFTLLKDQVLEIEIVEKNGARHQKVRLRNSDLIRAGLINGLEK